MQFADDRGVDYEQYFDGDGRFATALGLSTQPVTLFVRADGTIVEQTGQIDLDQIRAGAAAAARMIAALDARFAASFTAGLLAAVNPCGFVLLPTYLMFFLGMENLRPGGTERASIRRALPSAWPCRPGSSSCSPSSGRSPSGRPTGSSSRPRGSPWPSASPSSCSASPCCSASACRSPRRSSTSASATAPSARCSCSASPTRWPRSAARSRCSWRTCSAAVAAEGIGRGLLAFFWYGLGMALIVTGLTVTLAMANVALLRVLRRTLGVFEYIAGVFVLLTGLYLTWYWYHGITERRARRPGDQPGDVVAGVARQVHRAQPGDGRHARRGGDRRRRRAGLRPAPAAERDGADVTVTEPGTFAELLATPGRRGGLRPARPPRVHGVPRRLAGGDDRRDRRGRGRALRGQLLRGAPAGRPQLAHPLAQRVTPADSPALAEFLEHVDVVITIHGFGRRGLFTSLLLGGRNRELAEHVGGHLRAVLPAYSILTDLDAIPRELRGLHATNPVNLPRRCGVQIELPPRVRGSSMLWADWEGPGLTPHTEALIGGLVAAATSWS